MASDARPSLFDALEAVAVAADALAVGWGNYPSRSPELVRLEDDLIDALDALRKVRANG